MEVVVRGKTRNLNNHEVRALFSKEQWAGVGGKPTENDVATALLVRTLAQETTAQFQAAGDRIPILKAEQMMR